MNRRAARGKVKSLGHHIKLQNQAHDTIRRAPTEVVPVRSSQIDQRDCFGRLTANVRRLPPAVSIHSPRRVSAHAGGGLFSLPVCVAGWGTRRQTARIRIPPRQ